MLKWLDSFDNYGTTVDTTVVPAGILGRKYPVSAVPAPSYVLVEVGHMGGYALRMGYDDTNYLSPGPITTDPTMIVGCAFKFIAWPSVARILSFIDGTTLGMNLVLLGTGQIEIHCGDTTLTTTTAADITPGTWFYLEFKVLCDHSVGTYELRINGVNVASDTGQNTKAGSDSYHTTFRIVGSSTDLDKSPWYDDLYCLDGIDTGVSGMPNNDFLGIMKVMTIRPDAVGDSNDFTPSTAVDHYTCMDEVICDDDTSYVEDGTSGHKDLYNFSACGTAGDIKGIMINADCRDTDATSYSIKTLCKSGTITDTGDEQVIGTQNYVTKSRILELDPNTSTAWIAANLNVAQFGIEVA